MPELNGERNPVTEPTPEGTQPLTTPAQTNQLRASTDQDAPIPFGGAWGGSVASSTPSTTPLGALHALDLESVMFQWTVENGVHMRAQELARRALPLDNSPDNLEELLPDQMTPEGRYSSMWHCPTCGMTHRIRWNSRDELYEMEQILARNHDCPNAQLCRTPGQSPREAIVTHADPHTAPAPASAQSPDTVAPAPRTIRAPRCAGCRHTLHHSNPPDPVYGEIQRQENLCPACVRRFFRKCDECGDILNRSFVYVIAKPGSTTGETLAYCGSNHNNCLRKHAVCCDRCGEMTLKENIQNTPLGAYCRNCGENIRIREMQQSVSFRRTAGISRSWSVEIECQANGSDGSRLEWDGIRAKDDGSIDGENGVEYVLSCLTGDAGIKTLQNFTSELARTEHEVNSSCGLHVHIDARDLTVQHLKNLLRLVYTFEPVIYGLLPKARRTNDYCSPLRSIAPVVLRTLRDEVNFKWYLNSTRRYYGLNLHALAAHGSIEFRMHQGTIDFTKIRNWLLLCLSMVETCQDEARMGKMLGATSSNIEDVQNTPENLETLCEFLRLPRRTRTYFRNRWHKFNQHQPAGVRTR